jgi:hypothetical protein
MKLFKSETYFFKTYVAFVSLLTLGFLPLIALAQEVDHTTQARLDGLELGTVYSSDTEAFGPMGSAQFSIFKNTEDPTQNIPLNIDLTVGKSGTHKFLGSGEAFFGKRNDSSLIIGAKGELRGKSFHLKLPDVSAQVVNPETGERIVLGVPFFSQHEDNRNGTTGTGLLGLKTGWTTPIEVKDGKLFASVEFEGTPMTGMHSRYNAVNLCTDLSTKECQELQQRLKEFQSFQQAGIGVMSKAKGSLTYIPGWEILGQQPQFTITLEGVHQGYSGTIKKDGQLLFKPVSEGEILATGKAQLVF